MYRLLVWLAWLTGDSVTTTFAKGVLAHKAYQDQVGKRYAEFEPADFERARDHERLQQAESAYLEAQRRALEKNRHDTIVRANIRLGQVFAHQGRFVEAERRFQAVDAPLEDSGADKTAKPLHDVHRSLVFYYLGVLAWRMGRGKEAIELLKQSQVIDEELGDRDGVKAATEALAMVTEKPAAELEEAAASPQIDQGDEPPAADLAANAPSDLSTTIDAPPQVIWIVSHTMDANNHIREQLEDQLAMADRPDLSIAQSVFGPNDQAEHLGPEIANNNRVRAAIFVIEESSPSEAFNQQLRNAELTASDDELIRLFVVSDHERAPVSQRLPQHPELNEMLDVVYFPVNASGELALPLVEDVVEELRNHLKHAPAALSKAVVGGFGRSITVALSMLVSPLKRLTVGVAVVFALLAILAPTLGVSQWIAGRHALSAFLVGGAMLVLNIPLAFCLFRGPQIGDRLLRTSWLLRKLFVQGGATIVLCLFLIRLRLPISWVILGAVVGVLIDLLYRHSLTLRRRLPANELLLKYEKKATLQSAVTSIQRSSNTDLFAAPFAVYDPPQAVVTFAHGSSMEAVAPTVSDRLAERGWSILRNPSWKIHGSIGRQRQSELNRKADMHVMLMDAEAANRRWMGIELFGVLASREMTNQPECVVVTGPNALDNGRPVFQAANELSQNDSFANKLPVILAADATSEETINAIVAKCGSPAVFLPQSCGPLVAWLHAWSATIGQGALVLTLPIALFLSYGWWSPEGAAMLAQPTFQPLALLTAFLAGFAGQTSFHLHTRAGLYRVAAFSLAASAIVWLAHTPSLIASWGAAAALAGWISSSINVHDKAH